jgi:antitoxin component YwqK of YwqJK toxin-antitoxin module
MRSKLHETRLIIACGLCTVMVITASAEQHTDLLGIEVVSVEEGNKLLVKAGSPSLGNRKCAVVSVVDPDGPSAGIVAPGFAIRKINGASIDDVEAYHRATADVRRGMRVEVQGLYVRPGAGGKGVWVTGRAEIAIPDEAPLPKSQPMPLSARRNEDNLGERETSKALFLPLDNGVDEFIDYDANSKVFGSYDYTKGPNGEVIEQVCFVQKDTGWAATQEGYLVDGSATSDDVAWRGLRQQKLVRALSQGTFRAHGRFVLWGDVSNKQTVEERCRIEQEAKNSSGNPPAVDRLSASPRYSAHMFNGVPHGTTRWWNEKGALRAIANYMHDYKHLVYREFYTNGQVTMEEQYRYGMAHGPLRVWHDNGQLKLQGTQAYGRREGAETQWHQNGQIKTECAWQKDKLHGQWRDYYDNGQQKSQSEWLNGELAEDEKAWAQDGTQMEGRRKPLPPYEAEFELYAKLGDNYKAVVERQVKEGATPVQIDLLLKNTIRPFADKLRLELFEAQRQVDMGARPVLLEIAKGRLDGYLSVIGEYIQ